MERITLYTIPGCSKCASVRKHFDKCKISYVEADLFSDQKFVQEIKAYAGEVRAPAVVMGNFVLTEYEEIMQVFSTETECPSGENPS
ncbi:glutaredoxin family protein [Salisediminibacterium beveridgei]|uniref:Glutaredoxin domain-containing protein n=1 Tax=Salisediminibacterium beveridgei TaxID=632773 RepID=A0A1D7QYK3_9BACI|nr:glutaredoxin family protein [Salisediminibacterium beveridgei]AOM84080.1 hypothetical protein BBEV_2743 [Salisediminibacterium beveridgei]